MTPFYKKALDTLNFLMSEQTLEPIYERVALEYKEITLENTMKLLIRCKLTYNSRQMLMQMYKLCDEHKVSSDRIKKFIDSSPGYRLYQEQFNEIHALFDDLMKHAGRVIDQGAIMSNSSHR